MYKYKCRDCGALLYDDDITEYVTDYGQKYTGCPCCAGWAVAPCEQCIDCEQWVECEETSAEGRCHDCDMEFEESEAEKEELHAVLTLQS